MNPSVENAGPTPAAHPVNAPVNAPASEARLGLVRGDSPPAADTADAADAAAWAEVLAGWEDDARHRAYLARFQDLEGLATAGRRYRDVLAEHPLDPVAARFRDEVLKRALAQGLASLPRAAPEHPRAKLAIRIAAAVVIGGLLLAAALMAARLPPLPGAHP